MRGISGQKAWDLTYQVIEAHKTICESAKLLDDCKYEDLNGDLVCLCNSLSSAIGQNLISDERHEALNKYLAEILDPSLDKTYRHSFSTSLNHDGREYTCHHIDVTAGRFMITPNIWGVTLFILYQHYHNGKNMDWGYNASNNSFCFTGGKNSFKRLSELIDDMGLSILSCRPLRGSIYKYMKEEYKNMEKARRAFPAMALKYRITT